MSIPQIIILLEFASKTHTSSSKVSIINRSMVQPWVPPLSLLLPTCLGKSLKSRPLALPHTPHLWLRYMDDTFVIQEARHSQNLLQYINSQDPPYTVHHRGTKPRRSATFPGHFGFSWAQQHSSHHSLQKAYTYQPIPTL